MCRKCLSTSCRGNSALSHGGFGFWLVYLILVIAIVVVVAQHWNRRNLNRLISVGLCSTFSNTCRTAAQESMK